MVNILFICGKARRRSPTAADLAGAMPGVAADFAGLSADADAPLTPEQIDWADVVAIMERRQLGRLKRRLGRRMAQKRIVCLNIPDRYAYMDPELVARLTPQLRRILRADP